MTEGRKERKEQIKELTNGFGRENVSEFILRDKKNPILDIVN